MRSVVPAILGLLLFGVTIAPAAAQAWLRVGGADGRFLLEIPAPFDHPEPETGPDGAVTSVYIHAAPDLALRFEVVDLAPSAVPDLLGNAEHDPLEPVAGAVLVSRSDHRLGSIHGLAYVLRLDDGARVRQERLYRVGNRLYRILAVSTSEREDDPLIHRFLASVRLLD